MGPVLHYFLIQNTWGVIHLYENIPQAHATRLKTQKKPLQDLGRRHSLSQNLLDQQFYHSRPLFLALPHTQPHSYPTSCHWKGKCISFWHAYLATNNKCNRNSDNEDSSMLSMGQSWCWGPSRGHLLAQSWDMGLIPWPDMRSARREAPCLQPLNKKFSFATIFLIVISSI